MNDLLPHWVEYNGISPFSSRLAFLVSRRTNHPNLNWTWIEFTVVPASDLDLEVFLGILPESQNSKEFNVVSDCSVIESIPQNIVIERNPH